MFQKPGATAGQPRVRREGHRRGLHRRPEQLLPGAYDVPPLVGRGKETEKCQAVYLHSDDGIQLTYTMHTQLF